MQSPLPQTPGACPHSALAHEILNGDADFTVKMALCFLDKRYTISSWCRGNNLQYRKIGPVFVVSTCETADDYVIIRARDLVAGTYPCPLTIKSKGYTGDRAAANEALLTEIDKAIANGTIADVRPFKHYRQGRLGHAALTGAILDPYRISPNLANHLLFAHPTGKIVRLSETPHTCETADGEALPTMPMRLAAYLRDDATLPQWWPLAFDFGMILPAFQKAPPQ